MPQPGLILGSIIRTALVISSRRSAVFCAYLSQRDDIKNEMCLLLVSSGAAGGPFTFPHLLPFVFAVYSVAAET